MTNEEKLENFQMAAMKEARNKSTNIIQEFQNALNKEFEDHKAEKERLAQLKIKAETENLQREKNKQISSEQIHIKQELTKTHADLKEKIFVEVKDLLSEFMSTAEYQNLLINQIQKDMEFARGQKITIYIDPADAGRKNSLESATGVPLTVSEYSFIGGTRAVLSEQNILIDESFQTKLDEAYEDFSFGGGPIHE